MVRVCNPMAAVAARLGVDPIKMAVVVVVRRLQRRERAAFVVPGGGRRYTFDRELRPPRRCSHNNETRNTVHERVPTHYDNDNNNKYDSISPARRSLFNVERIIIIIVLRKVQTISDTTGATGRLLFFVTSTPKCVNREYI